MRAGDAGKHLTPRADVNIVPLEENSNHSPISPCFMADSNTRNVGVSTISMAGQHYPAASLAAGYVSASAYTTTPNHLSYAHVSDSRLFHRPFAPLDFFVLASLIRSATKRCSAPFPRYRP